MLQVKRSVLESSAEEAAIESENLRFDYSARGMMGDRCFGITGSIATFGQFLIALSAQNDETWELAMRLAESAATDSMGKETIFYWPYLGILD